MDNPEDLVRTVEGLYRYEKTATRYYYGLRCNPDTKETDESVHISEVSLFEEFNCMQELFLGNPYVREVSLERV